MGMLTRRLHTPEWMDTEEVSAADFAACLRDLAAVNTVTLARRPTLLWLDRVARRHPRRTLRVLDVASGGGDMLRAVARWGARRGVAVELTGVDINPLGTAAAVAATPAGLPIRYETGDVFALPAGRRFDVVISSLFTHHLSDDEVVRFLRWMEGVAELGWFVNDLQRSELAARGFAMLAGVAGWHRFVRHDGPLSVRRAFSRTEWPRLLRAAGVAGRVRARAPFRLCVEGGGVGRMRGEP